MLVWMLLLVFSSCSSGEEAVTTAKEAYFTTNPTDDVFDEKDTDLKEDHMWVLYLKGYWFKTLANNEVDIGLSKIYM